MSTTEAPRTKRDFVRSQALQATRALLAIHGLSLTMDQIADDSGISRRSLFRHFDSRNALVRAALEAALDDYEEALTSASSVDGELDAWLVNVLSYTHRSHLSAGLAIWQLSSTADDNLPPYLVETTRRRRAMRRRLTDMLAAQAWELAGGTGEPPDIVTEVMAMTVSSCTTHSLVRDLEQPTDEAARLNAAIIKTVIEANLQPTKRKRR